MSQNSTVYIVYGIPEDIGLRNRRTKMVSRQVRQCPEGHAPPAPVPGERLPHCGQCGKRFEWRTVEQPQVTHISEAYPLHRAFEGGDEVILGVLIQQIDPNVDAGAWAIGVSGVMLDEVKHLLQELGRPGVIPAVHLVADRR